MAEMIPNRSGRPGGARGGAPDRVVIPRGLYRSVVDRLGREVVGGSYLENALLPPEKDVAERFGVSRAVVREALKVLAGKGLVDGRPKIGTWVQPRSQWQLMDPEVLEWMRELPDEKFMRDLIEVRITLEPAAARYSALRATDEEIAALQSALEEMEHLTDQRELYNEVDLRFHGLILSSSKNELILRMEHAIDGALALSRRVTGRIVAEAAEALPGHWVVLDAIRAHDAPGARRAMENLILESGHAIEQVLGVTLDLDEQVDR